MPAAISKTPLIGKFVWRDLMTDDPAAAKPFYAGLFGWEFVETQSLGRPYTRVRSGGQFIAGTGGGPPQGGAPQGGGAQRR